MKYCTKCGYQMDDSEEFCPKCGTRCGGTGPTDSSRADGSAPPRQTEAFAQAKGKARIVFAVLGAITAAAGVLLLVQGLVEKSREIGNAVGTFVWMALLSVMFWVFAYSPKTSPYLLGKSSGMKKWQLAVLCAVGGLVVAAVVSNLL